jgi:hypothetical protein
MALYYITGLLSKASCDDVSILDSVTIPKVITYAEEEGIQKREGMVHRKKE